MAGAIVALSAERLPRRFRLASSVSGTILLLAALLAMLPDVDLLFPYPHRSATHSFVAVALVVIITAAVTGRVTGRIDWAIALICGAAWASHLLVDWLGQDQNYPRGIQALWPFNDRWFISDWDIFRNTERFEPFSLPTIRYNAITAIAELLQLGPILVVLWVTRQRDVQGKKAKGKSTIRNTRRSRGRICGRGVRRPPSA
jgi:membrane-bound metal-dependent hydrolase YbcI (DUF457 family)